MKKVSILILILTTKLINVKGQCTATYNYSGTNDTLAFTNTSVISNAHYYWNFGDGSGSNAANPIHIFPDNGEYLVTLYGFDTVLNCVDVYENWISVTKPDTITCNLLLSDTIENINGDDFLITTNLSSNCSNWLNIDCDAGPGHNQAWNIWLSPFWKNALFIDRLQAYTYTVYDTISEYRVFSEYYKTVPYLYTSNNNYQNCSANFEIITDYQTNGALVKFTAMNKNATNYCFYITGFGNPILLSGYSVSYLFPYINYEKYFPWNVYLIINDSINNCSDTVSQQILIKNPYYVIPAGIDEISTFNFSIYPNPAQSQITIKLAEKETENTLIEIKNLYGETLYSEQKTKWENIGTVNISTLPPGIYFVQIQGNDCVFSKKFIKQ